MRTDKKEAFKMRDAGWSYSDISANLGVPKSTLSGWFKSLPFTPNDTVQERVNLGRGMYGLRRHQQRLSEAHELKVLGEQEVGELSHRDLWMVGIGLWLGEGSKTIEQLRLVNSDPRVISLYIRWLKEVCELENSNITVAMHLYPDSNERVCMDYWSDITGLPPSQFRKTQVDRRLGKNTLKEGKSIHGTLHVTVVSNRNPERGVRLYRRLMGWVSAVSG